MNLPFFIARRYLLKQKGRFSSFIIRLATIATTLSVAVMIVAIAVVIGFKHEIKDRIFNFWGNVHVVPYTTSNTSIISPEPIEDMPDLVAAAKNKPEVKNITPFATRPVIINANQLTEGILIKGISHEYQFPQGIDITGSRQFTDSNYDKTVILSKAIADKVLVNIGDDILLYFLEPGASFPRIRKVKVAGIYHTGLEDIDQKYAICDVRFLQKINGWAANEINGYQIELYDDKNAEAIADKIFNDYIPQNSTLTTYTMKDVFPGIFDWLQIQNMTAGLVLLVMAIVAIINLAAALLILIVEQARMVGVLKAQGMSNGMIQKIFLYHAGLIGGVGVLLGNIVGLGLCFIQKQTGVVTLMEDAYFMKTAPVHIVWWHVVLIDIVTLVLCILFMWLPSLYIRRINPAKVLQFK